MSNLDPSSPMNFNELDIRPSSTQERRSVFPQPGVQKTRPMKPPMGSLFHSVDSSSTINETVVDMDIHASPPLNLPEETAALMSADSSIDWSHARTRKSHPANQGSQMTISLPASLLHQRSSSLSGAHSSETGRRPKERQSLGVENAQVTFAKPRRSTPFLFHHVEDAPNDEGPKEVSSEENLAAELAPPKKNKKVLINIADSTDTVPEEEVQSTSHFKRKRTTKTRWQLLTDNVMDKMRTTNRIAPDENSAKRTQPHAATIDWRAEENSGAFVKPVESSLFKTKSRTFVLDPASAAYMYWLFVVTLAVWYNTWTVILRVTFDLNTSSLLPIWLTFDYICDFVYALDIFVRIRTGFIMHGLLVTDTRMIYKSYIQKRQYMDIVSVLPLELFFIGLGYNPAFRFNRLLKIHRWMRCESKFEHRSNNAGFSRLVFLMHKLVLVSHFDACFYYLISHFEGLGSNTWVQPSPVAHSDIPVSCLSCVDPTYAEVLKQYLASLYWSTSLLMTVGVGTNPVTTLEFFFVIGNNIMGVCMFGVLVGNIGLILSQINADKSRFQTTVDKTKQYMTTKHFPQDFQDQVKRWYDYVWTRYSTLNEQEDLLTLPGKLQGDMALMTHIDALRRVKLFDGCGEYILRVVALSLQQRIYNPGDFIVLKNEIGLEMYIIQDGIVEVLDFHDDEEIVYAALTAGQYFGELALLSLTALGSRRTAYVRAVGFVEVFVLHKNELQPILASDSSLRQNLANRASKLLGDIGHDANPTALDPKSQQVNFDLITRPRTGAKSAGSRKVHVS